ncbi:MAG: cytochrome P450 [Planctomycetaceae bacterium]|nr:cytochrome P450 [Planctomycetaceae bacterium]
MTRIPKHGGLDHSLSLLSDPYRYITKTCDRLKTDVFYSRLLLQKVICMRGKEAAKLFYDSSRFSREGVSPSRIAKTLFGQGGVQGLDDEAHLHRKAMFMSIVRPDRVDELAATFRDVFQQRLVQWTKMNSVLLYRQVQEIITIAVCRWAGVPLPDEDVDRRTTQLASLFDYAANIGPKHWYARISRKQTNAWLGELIEQVRRADYQPPKNSAAEIIALHRELDGNQLSTHVAAVELNNVIRPTIAVSAFIVQSAHALHQHPEYRQRIVDGEGAFLQCFAQEVRRFYPFFPFAGAKTRESFEWNGYRFPAGQKVLLDLYGTDHSPRIWESPEHFNPDRFKNWQRCPFSLIPQGGGDYDTNHRCPGEPIAIELMKVALDLLVNHCQYEVPEQELAIDMRRMPAIPASGFTITKLNLTNNGKATA